MTWVPEGWEASQHWLHPPILRHTGRQNHLTSMPLMSHPTPTCSHGAKVSNTDNCSHHDLRDNLHRHRESTPHYSGNPPNKVWRRWRLVSYRNYLRSHNLTARNSTDTGHQRPAPNAQCVPPALYTSAMPSFIRKHFLLQSKSCCSRPSQKNPEGSLC